MRTVTRRTLALLLCLMLCISALPAALAAEDLEEVVDLEETALPAEPEEIGELAYYLTVLNRSITGEDTLIDNGEMLKSNFIW